MYSVANSGHISLHSPFQAAVKAAADRFGPPLGNTCEVELASGGLACKPKPWRKVLRQPDLDLHDGFFRCPEPSL